MSENNAIIPNGPVLVVLVGPSGSGKSTFCKTHFDDREVVSSDELRIWLSGQFERQDKNVLVFEEFHRRIEMKLRAGQRVVADATHLRNADRRKTAEIGYMLDVPVFYVIINRSVVGKLQTGGWRNDVRIKGRTLIEAHEETFVANEKTILDGDDFKWVSVIDTRDENLNLVVAKPLPRTSSLSGLIHLWDHKYRSVRVLGDVHGNLDGLTKVINTVTDDTFMLFLGDITDYGKESWECVRIVNDLVSSGKAIMVRGNHDKKMTKYIEQTMKGEEFSGNITFGMDISTNQLKAMHPNAARRYQMEFLSLVEQSPDWIELDDWLFAHAAVDHNMFGNNLFRANKNSYLETMALYGETDGTTTEGGFPNRTYGWIEKMPNRKNAVLGHQIMSVEAPVVETTPTGGKVVFLDTGSSKDKNGISGFLSYMDFDIVFSYKTKKILELIPNWSFGRE